jgi:hypothetical protein
MEKAIVKVHLEWYEVQQAAIVGVMRRIASYRAERKNTYVYTSTENNWDRDIESACAEMAFAKGNNWYWPGSVDKFKEPDVAGFQVRHTKFQNGCLVVRTKDNPEEPFVLVTGIHPDYRIAGWMYGHAARCDKWKKDDYSWFVPQPMLMPITDLPQTKELMK